MLLPADPGDWNIADWRQQFVSADYGFADISK